MTRDEFMAIAEHDLADCLQKEHNRIMGIISRAWAEGKRNAEIDSLVEIIKEAQEMANDEKTGEC